MIKYNITTNKNECVECRILYKIYAKELFADMKYTKMYCMAKDEDKLIGCVGLNESKSGHIYINYTIILPDYRKQGICKNTLQYAINTLKKQKGVRSIKVNNITIPGNTFTECGMELVETIECRRVYKLYIGDKK